MTRAIKLRVCSPLLYAVDPLFHSLTLEYIEGVSVEDVFLEFRANGAVEERSAKIWEAIAKVHDGGLVHGDLREEDQALDVCTCTLLCFVD